MDFNFISPKKYSFALLITITCAFCTTGAAFLRIRKSPRGTFEDLRIGSGTWMESFLVVGNKMAFFVGLILMNWENQKRSLTATVGLVMIVAAYINYWVMYKEVKKTYPYSPYHLLWREEVLLNVFYSVSTNCKNLMRW